MHGTTEILIFAIEWPHYEKTVFVIFTYFLKVINLKRQYLCNGES